MKHRRWFAVTCVLLLATFVFCPAAAVAQGEGTGGNAATNPFAGNTQAVSEGKIIFEAVCAGYCHATEGATREGRCPNLFDCEWKHGGSDREVFQVVSAGVPQTE
ncbi:MAG: hypothetical protein NZ578_03885, partial [Candidatus Binatia bacterium]|nr:hypothetical protein [Candidatus Binatia bacterium]